VIYDCLTSELNGYRCSFSKSDTEFARLSKDLKGFGKASCTVSGVRVVGRNDTDGFVEVACSDGLPGWVLAYPVNVSSRRPRSSSPAPRPRASAAAASCRPTSRRPRAGFQVRSPPGAIPAGFLNDPPPLGEARGPEGVDPVGPPQSLRDSSP
jgi:hypothetical protein